MHENSGKNTHNNANNNAKKDKVIHSDCPGRQRSNSVRPTQKAVSQLSPNRKSTIYWFDGIKGFGIRVSPKGRKSWIVQYMSNDNSRKVVIGRYPEMSLRQARQVFAEMMLNINLGADPYEEKQELRLKQRNDITVKELLDRYVKHCIQTGKKTYNNEYRAIRNGLGETLLKKRISQITPRDISKIVNEKIANNTPVMAKSFLKYTKRLFNYAASLMLLNQANNPCIGLKANVPNKKRDRHLSPKEIYRFWHNLDSFPVDRILILALRFLLVTAARTIELRSMRWSDVDLIEGVWTIPETKNGRMHRVYLGSLALKILNEAKQYTSDAEFVFSCKKYNGRSQAIDNQLKAFKVWSLSQVFRRHFNKLNITQRFYPHDLRRTAATLIAGLFGRRDFAAMVLNHTTSDVTGIYDHYTYDREKKIAWDALDKALVLIINSPDLQNVPSFDGIRSRVFTKEKTVPLNSFYTVEGSQSNVSSPVAYTLSYGHEALMK
jgi:integrase